MPLNNTSLTSHSALIKPTCSTRPRHPTKVDFEPWLILTRKSRFILTRRVSISVFIMSNFVVKLQKKKRRKPNSRLPSLGLCLFIALTLKGVELLKLPSSPSNDATKIRIISDMAKKKVRFLALFLLGRQWFCSVHPIDRFSVLRYYRS